MDTPPAGAPLVVHVSGDIDMASAASLHARLTDAIGAAAPDELIVADLTAVTFCDSQGIRALILAHDLARTTGRRFTITGALGGVEQVLRVAGVLDLLTSP